VKVFEQSQRATSMLNSFGVHVQVDEDAFGKDLQNMSLVLEPLKHLKMKSINIDFFNRSNNEYALEKFDATTFIEYPNWHESLTYILLDQLRVKTIDSRAFICLKNLVELQLFNMNLKEIKVDAFEGCENLYYVALSGNLLEGFEEGTLDHLPNLTFLCLDNNLIKSFPSGLFRKLEKLECFSLNQNPLSVDLDEDTFLGLKNLDEICLEQTPLGHVIDRNSPIISKHLTKLETINL
jgi:insulin-like growth factor-binding protein complex acid labile subunit